jgi:hypothetical protein
MTKTRAIDLRVVVVLLAGLLTAVAVWAGTSWAAGSAERSPAGSTPAQNGGGSEFTQSGGSGGDDRRDCPNKGGGGERPSTSENSVETAV